MFLLTYLNPKLGKYFSIPESPESPELSHPIKKKLGERYREEKKERAERKKYHVYAPTPQPALPTPNVYIRVRTLIDSGGAHVGSSPRPPVDVDAEYIWC